MTFPLLLNIVVFAALLLLVGYIGRRKNLSLALKVLLGLVLGSAFGLALQFVYGGAPVVARSIDWFDIVGNGYVRLLQLIVVPLVLVSVLSAVVRVHKASSLGRISVLVLGVLLFTTLIAAVVGVLIANLFGLSAEGLLQGDRESARLATISGDHAVRVAELNVPRLLLSFIPVNVFQALTGAGSTAIINVVVFAALLGFAALQLVKVDAAKGEAILRAIDTLQALVMKLVSLVIRLTPYGVLALMTKMVAGSSLADILRLGTFVIASYAGLALLFGVHAGLLGLSGFNPARFFRAALPALSFAFTSRSSAAAIPLNIAVQTRRLGVPEAIATFAASFGATIGQNGCAGLYPAMLAVMVAPTVGIDPLDPAWIAMVVGIVTISSIGVAGVGGGATFSALIVLPALGLPITLVALLISIEPLIDMGRTALNVSGSMTAGTVTSQLLGQTREVADSDEALLV